MPLCWLLKAPARHGPAAIAQASNDAMKVMRMVVLPCHAFRTRFHADGHGAARDAPELPRGSPAHRCEALTDRLRSGWLAR